MTINIGLNNNPFKYEELSEAIGYSFGGRCQFRLGQWGETPEPTLVALLPRPLTIDELTLLLCLTKQECIAVWEDGEGYLDWHPNFPETCQFDERFFIHHTAE